MNIRKIVKKVIPAGLFPAIEPYGHLAEAVLLNTINGFPGRKLKVIGVTGTNGKTSTTYLIHRMLHEAGYKTGLMTTVAYGAGMKIQPQMHHMTSVSQPELMKRLRWMRSQGVEWLVLETTSQALAQNRVWGVPYSVAVMTNLTEDDSGWHKSFEAYRDAKVKLFKLTGANRKGHRTGIVNAADPSASYFAAAVPFPITYGQGVGQLQATDIAATPQGSTFTAKYENRELSIKVNLPGSFNVDNALAAAGAGIAVGLTDEQIEKGIAALEGVEGRMTTIDEGQDFAAFREEIRNQILIARLHQQMVGNRINVSEQEIDNQIANAKTSGSDDKEYRLSHILIPVPEGAGPDAIRAAEDKAKETVAKLRGGADFAATAVSVSAGQTALQGGDLGWRSAAQLPTVLVETVRGLTPGEITDPIRAAGGFHIVKLNDVRGDGRHVVTQTHVRHILLTADELLPENELQNRLAQLRARIQGGEDFAALARSHSKDKVSASKGGDLGWVNPGDLVPQFEEAMNALKPNEVSEPVQTRFGWHIIQVLDRREHDSTDEFKRNQVREQIRKRKTDEELALWLRRRRDEAYVEYRTGEE